MLPSFHNCIELFTWGNHRLIFCGQYFIYHLVRIYRYLHQLLVTINNLLLEPLYIYFVSLLIFQSGEQFDICLPIDYGPQLFLIKEFTETLNYVVISMKFFNDLLVHGICYLLIHSLFIGFDFLVHFILYFLIPFVDVIYSSKNFRQISFFLQKRFSQFMLNAHQSALITLQTQIVVKPGNAFPHFIIASHEIMNLFSKLLHLRNVLGVQYLNSFDARKLVEPLK